MCVAGSRARGQLAGVTPERWRQVNELFQATLDRQPAERQPFLETQTAGDPDLLHEVETLLRSHARAAGFLDEPAWGVAAGLVLDEPRSLTGRQLGPYWSARRIGRGGMGVVYAARDQRLGRAVAMKALTPEFTRDHARRERLTREARAAAALSHPAIATVFALEEIDGELYIVSELIAGAHAARGACRRRTPARPASRHADRYRGGTRGGARPRHRASRSETGERNQAQRRPDQGPRLRHRQVRAVGQRDVVHAAHRYRCGDRNPRLHGARATRGRQRGLPRRRVCVRRARMGAGDGGAPVRPGLRRVSGADDRVDERRIAVDLTRAPAARPRRDRPRKCLRAAPADRYPSAQRTAWPTSDRSRAVRRQLPVEAPRQALVVAVPPGQRRRPERRDDDRGVGNAALDRPAVRLD